METGAKRTGCCPLRCGHWPTLADLHCTTSSPTVHGLANACPAAPPTTPLLMHLPPHPCSGQHLPTVPGPTVPASPGLRHPNPLTITHVITHPYVCRQRAAGDHVTDCTISYYVLCIFFSVL